MDVARDLVDRQLVDHEDERECGRVDDLWIEWSREGAHLGALASGAAIVLDQFGALVARARAGRGSSSGGASRGSSAAASSLTAMRVTRSDPSHRR